MQILPLLLRLLLCVSLAMNGVGFAYASTSMQLAHVDMTTAVETSVPSADACHESPDTGPTTAAAADTPTAPHDDSPAVECCEGEACQCVCTASVPLASCVSVSAHAGLAPEQTAAHANSRHRAPRLPHLIRPPIG